MSISSVSRDSTIQYLLIKETERKEKIKTKTKNTIKAGVLDLKKGVGGQRNLELPDKKYFKFSVHSWVDSGEGRGLHLTAFTVLNS